MPIETGHMYRVLQTRPVRLLGWLGALLLTGSLFSLGATPVAVNLVNPPWDKLLHFATFAALATCIMVGNAGRKPWLALGMSLLFACLDEGVQFLEPGRHPGFDDLLADSAGIVCAVLACRWLYRRVHEA